jgi:Tol biopolymer transport system component
VWVDQKGGEEIINLPANGYVFPKVSPDGTQIAVTIGPSSSSDIWILDLVRKNRMQLTSNPGPDFCAFWTSDGKRVLFSSASKDGLYWKAADGAGEEELLLSFVDGMPTAWSWADNDETLVLTNLPANYPSFDIGVVSMNGDRKYEPLLQEEYQEREPQISPDGRFMTYASNKEGDLEVYIRMFPEVNERVWKVSTDGGNNPLWSPDGDMLYYRDKDAIMAVTVQIDPDLKLGTPQTLFKGPYVTVGTTIGTSWDIHPDGKKFLMMKPTGSGRLLPRKINIVTNWFEELKEKVPVP